MSSDKVLKDTITKAQDLVKDVDPALREAAFSIILQRLLEGNSVPMSSSMAIRTVQTAKVKESEGRASSSKGGPKDRVRELIGDNFFQEPKSMKNILDELGSRSFHYKDTDLTRQMQEFVREKQLRRLQQQNEKGRQVTHWVKW